MLMAIGQPELIDTRHDSRLSRIFSNKVLKVYPAFREFYGMEDAIEQVVAYFRHAAQGPGRKSRFCICWARWAAASRRLPKSSKS